MATGPIHYHRSIRDYVLAHPDGDEIRGAKLGIADYVAEEVILLIEQGEQPKMTTLEDVLHMETMRRIDGYDQFLERKRIVCHPSGFTVPRDSLHKSLMPFQRDIVHWALKRGKAALWEDCGLGKTIQQLEWGRHVVAHTGKPVILFAPLAVSRQTAEEANKFSIGACIIEKPADIRPGINIINYEKMHHLTPDGWGGIILDESSILKGFDGKTRKALTDFASSIPYRLACTATPSPNDYMEVGNHAEFLGVLNHVEMLSLFFCHDGGETSKWRLKGHAEEAFWKWMCSWAVAIRKPSDLGYEDGDFKLPKLHMHQVIVESGATPEGYLFPVEAQTLQERNSVRRESIGDRVAECARLVNGSKDPWLVWCNLNDESGALADAIQSAVEVRGSGKSEDKENALLDFAHGRERVLVSKPSICGFGMNFQVCAHIAFVGLSDSYEQFYQAIRRCWRFGQKREVHCYVITSEAEGAVVRNIERKERQDAERMDAMVGHMKTEMQREIRGLEREKVEYSENIERGAGWGMMLGDCVTAVREMPPESIDFSVFSPPFASLYTYSNSDRDMGNSKDFAEFESHFRFLVTELFRVLKAGRLVAFHCMNLPLTKERDGVIGIRDFRGELIRWFQNAGFIFHSEVCIWKDPVTAMQRTKAIGLLYKQLRKDSTISRQGIPDYLVTMRKPGVNPDPVTKTYNSFPVDRWQQYASPVWELSEKQDAPSIFDFIDPHIYDSLSDDGKAEVMRTVLHHAQRVVLAPVPLPVWMNINPSDTLQRESVREDEDERHICPLQLEVIRRAIELWTNPGDLVLSPFAGIGSEGFVALEMKRKFLGVELKQSYWGQACANLRRAERIMQQDSLFANIESMASTFSSSAEDCNEA